MNLRNSVGATALLCCALAASGAAQCTFSQSSVPARPVLVYRFAVHGAGDSSVLGVTLEFTGSASGVDTIGVPAQWAGQRLHGMRDLHAVDGGTVLDSIPGSARRLARHAPNATVRLAYALARDWNGPFDHPDEFHAIILGDYVELTGSNALVHPVMDSYKPVIAQFDWSAIPLSWALATSFGAADAGANSGKRCQTFIGTWFDVANALYAAGDFRIRDFKIGRKPAVLAIRGTWAFSDSAVVGEVQRDVGAVRDFWHDYSFPYFLVTWAPFDRDHGDNDGTAFTNALWIFMSRKDSLSTQITQLTHESFHAWNPRRMGRVPDSDQRKLVWFHEGFTTYYADLIAYRAGFLPLPSVIARANRSLRSFDGVTDPYIRGDVIAWWLDGAIRHDSKNTHSLDDVMRAMVREADQPFTLARLLATADRYLTGDDAATLRDLATGTGAAPLTLSAGALAPCARATLDSVYKFDAGLDVQASAAARRVTAVRQGSAAYAAGLRDGQPLANWSIDPGDADKPAVFVVLNDSTETRISYLPRGAASLAPQLHVAGGGSATCAVRRAGR